MVLRICRAALVTLACAVWSILPATAGTLTGEVDYRERMALPADALVEVSLVDVTRADSLGELIAAVQIRPQQQVPIPFRIPFADPEIEPEGSYAVRARIIADGRLLFFTPTLPRVLTKGHPAHVRISLAAVSSGHGARELVDKAWLAEDIGGRGVLDKVRSHVAISSGGKVSGSAGCNVLHGVAQVDGDSLAFGVLGTTRRMCPPAVMDQEAAFLLALDRTRRFRIDGPNLTFLGPAGEALVRFSAIQAAQ